MADIFSSGQMPHDFKIILSGGEMPKWIFPVEEGFSLDLCALILPVESSHAFSLLENGDLISENEKDSNGGVEINSPISKDHPNSFNKGNWDLEEWRIAVSSVHIYEQACAVIQIVEEVEAGDVLQIEQRDVEEVVGDETEGQGTELKSNSILLVKAVKTETEEELENASVYIERIERLESAMEKGLLDVITGSRTQFQERTGNRCFVEDRMLSKELIVRFWPDANGISSLDLAQA
ncbi:hypothetical protein NL676_010774 [Syzygium grande]|nr:hypothetical protein NL676_010774 [Syzygium grande]